MIARGKEIALPGPRDLAVHHAAVIHVGKENPLIAVRGGALLQKQLPGRAEIQGVIGLVGAGVSHHRAVHIGKIGAEDTAAVRPYPFHSDIIAVCHY